MIISFTGVDPKSVVCAFFKQGQCGKGAKCKFSHDLNVSRKGEKRNLYEDVRGDEGEFLLYPITVEPAYVATCIKGPPVLSSHIF